MSKKKKQDDLDMQTTVADMNVEGFSWYDPKKKKGEKRSDVQLTKKEYRAMVRGAYRAMLPVIGCIVCGALVVFLLAYLWLR